MVPFADLFNHKLPTDVRWTYEKSSSRAGWVGFAKHEVKQGEQVYDAYGRQANNKLLNTYGFVDTENPIPIEFTLGFDFKKTLPQLKEILGEHWSTNHDASAVPSATLLSTLRTAFFDDVDNIDFVIESIAAAENEDAIAPISVHNELTVMIELIKACHSRLENFPRTLIGDGEMLQKDDLTTNQRNILLLTKERKK